MAKISSVQKNKNRAALVAKLANKRQRLKAIAKDRSLSPEEQFEARLKLAQLPRNSSKTRLRNRCELTGRPRAFYRKFRLCRVMLRELASAGQIPGMVKSSW